MRRCVQGPASTWLVCMQVLSANTAFLLCGPAVLCSVPFIAC
jgi:hypothetical protein